MNNRCLTKLARHVVEHHMLFTLLVCPGLFVDTARGCSAVLTTGHVSLVLETDCKSCCLKPSQGSPPKETQLKPCVAILSVCPEKSGVCIQHISMLIFT